MTSKEKAEDLIKKLHLLNASVGTVYRGKIRTLTGELSMTDTKKCALICVDEIIKSHGKNLDMIDFDYWNEVKKEIEKL